MDNWFLTLIRLVVPLTILKWPLSGLVLSGFIDYRDWGYYKFENQDDYRVYQIWDKLLDTYYLGFAAIKTFSWKDAIASKVGVYSFLERAIGVFLFVSTNNRYFLLFFPNFFENFFFFYIFYKTTTNRTILFTNTKRTIVIVIALLIPKLIQEYLYHIAQIQIWKVIDIADFLGIENIAPNDFSFWFWVGLYLLFPFIMFVWIFIKEKRSNIRN